MPFAMSVISRMQFLRVRDDEGVHDFVLTSVSKEKQCHDRLLPPRPGARTCVKIGRVERHACNAAHGSRQCKIDGLFEWLASSKLHESENECVFNAVLHMHA